MPAPDDPRGGGHAICLVGYDDSKRLFTFRNSWGESRGDKGYGILPYAYVLDPNLANDFGVILTES
jgi:C1A family cysteine protease